ncbi:peptidyl-prolyl cis-trans isomerase FKBP14 [Striga asiatica]|uniref:Peptidyl-prolyl cis-trans isomerase FKBP14 n=1 Tax=Striga asiatica TaxID=4170 RepID=A0A5A7PZ43_STRAF|nr:peptidyl-prolyl cis-trans isomerase FKBP14 [Striga asiatica]
MERMTQMIPDLEMRLELLSKPYLLYRKGQGIPKPNRWNYHSPAARSIVVASDPRTMGQAEGILKQRAAPEQRALKTNAKAANQSKGLGKQTNQRVGYALGLAEDRPLRRFGVS